MQTTKIYDLQSEGIRNILIVRQHHQLGDMLCSLPMYAAIRKKFPDSRITLVASPYNGKILQGTTEKFIDKILIYDKSSMIQLIKFINKLLSVKYDLCIVPSTVSMSRTSHIICRLTGARFRVGVNSVEGKQNRSAGYLNIKSDFNWDKDKKHQAERNLDIVRQIGCEMSRNEMSLVRLEIQEKEIKFAKDYAEKNFEKGKPIAAFHTGAGKPQNRWSTENFIKLIEKIYEKYKANILLTNGPNEIQISGKIIKELEKKKIKVLGTLFPVIRLAAIIRLADVYVTNDTGTLHIAGYTGANVIGLFGPTHAYEWGPLNEEGTYIQAENGDINSITVDRVMKTVEKYLNK